MASGFRANNNFIREWRTENGPAWQQRVGEAGIAAIRREAPVDSGEMTARMWWEPRTNSRGQTAVRYWFPAEHTLYVDQGTGVHGLFKRYITPNAAKALRWMTATGPRFAARVKGQVGQRFVRRGLETVFDRVVEYRHGVGPR